ncbi:GLPGLI family protein [Flammeovirga aprica]|uniref:GLPGLI family protein n=1 Tax=Flammeovirga aprica JL-4 TaxID=694437 RepID=A0A7X9P3S6_9BACT|nr:GLPGLI family protein [Flammeovirga aprica]NME68632.1 GLPGLI family protein [Flammeovirga aprica JL-4]
MKLLTLFALLLLPSFSLLAQITPKGYSTYKCTYVYDYQPFHNDTTRAQEKFVLIFNDHFSKFLNYDYYLFGLSLERQFEKNSLNKNSDVTAILAIDQNEIVEPKSNNFSVMKDYQTKEATYIYNLGYIANCSFTENYGELEWVITNESKVIKGYNCILAKAEYGLYKVEAWFTPEIPVSDGPYLFAGLPGLILSLNNQENKHSFLIEEIQSDTTVMLTDNITGRAMLEPLSFKKAYRNMLKQRKLLELGYDIEKNNPLYPNEKLPMLENQSDDHIKELMLKYTFYNNLFFKLKNIE